MKTPATKCVAVRPKAVAVSPRLPELLTFSRMVSQ